MRYVVLLLTGIMCRQGTPPPQAPAPTTPCAIASDADLFDFLRAHDCVVATGDSAPPRVDVRLVRGGPDYAGAVSFRVVFENRGAAPVPLELVLDDQRLCFELANDKTSPTRACTLIEKAPAEVESRVRVILQPHVTARVDGLVFLEHTFYEKYEKSGAIGMFEKPLPRGTYDVDVSVPLVKPMLLHTAVTIP